MAGNINLKINSNGISEIIFNNKDLKVNVLSSKVMTELDSILEKIKNSDSIKVLVFKSAKPGIFIAGADIKEIKDIIKPEDAFEKSNLGQEIINKIEKLPFTTVSIINGACLGAGLELSLATNFRIVSDSNKVQLGLPETTLGILPGFGGTVRLPKLVGLIPSLDMILSGKSVNGLKAYKLKLADAYFPEAFLDDKSNEFIKKILSKKNRKVIYKKRKKRKFNETLVEGNPFARMMVFSKVKKDLIKKTRMFYPAPLEALNTIRKNFKKNFRKALFIERESFSKLAVTEVSKRLINVFLLNEKIKKTHKLEESLVKKINSNQIESIGLLGAGKMGGGIAWLFSNADISVRMKDISWNAVASGYKAIKDIYSELIKIKKINIREAELKIKKISGTIDYSGFSNADIIIEAIIEDKDIKIKTLKEIESIVSKNAIISTNTSSFSVKELSSGLKYPERFIGFHFFNPVNRMPLIEVVKGPKTSNLTVQKMIALAQKLKKSAVVINDCNGFLVNRILMTYLNEAILMVEEGADFVKIDRAIYDFGMPMGPFTLLDEIGIKVGYKVAKVLFNAYPERSKASKIFSAIGSSDDISGKTSGKGFFIYKKNKKIPNQAIYEILEKNKIKKNYEISKEEIIERCVLRMILEASLSIEEKIIDNPEFIDLSLILGIGFPPFRGGLLKYADDIGLDKIISNLEKYHIKYGARFKPSALLLNMAKKKERFYL